jgi:hypothetical protein
MDAAPLLGAKGEPGDVEKWILSDAEVVLTVNVKQFFAAEAVKKNLPALKAAMEKNEELKSVLELTGIDLFKDIHTIIVSGSGTSAKDARGLLVIRGNFNTDKINDAIKKKGEGVKSHKEGDHTIYEVPVNEQTAFASLVDRNTFVVTQSKDATVDAIKNGGKKSPKLSKDMKSALKQFSGKESLAFAMVVSDDLKKMVAMVPQLAASANKLQTLTGSVTVSEAVTLNITGNTDDAKAARQLMSVLTILKGTAEVAVQGMEGIPPVVNDVLDALKIASDKNSVTVDLKLSKEILDKASKLKDK